MELERKVVFVLPGLDIKSYGGQSDDNMELFEAFVSRLREELEAGRTVTASFHSAIPSKGQSAQAAVAGGVYEEPEAKND